MSMQTFGKLTLPFSTEVLDIARTLSNDTERNVFFSPFSAIVALSILHHCVHEKTKIHIQKVLGIPDQDLHAIVKSMMATLTDVTKDQIVEMKSVSALWFSHFLQLQQEVIDSLKGLDVQINVCNFHLEALRCVETVNAYVKEHTNGCIPHILDRISPDTQMLLVNAVFFKGTWQSQFSPSRTRMMPFTLLNGTQIQTPMMAQRQYFHYYESEEFQILQLPYKNKDIVMNVLLPAKNDAETFKRLSSAAFLTQFQNGIPATKRVEVDVDLPKFTVTSTIDLKEVLSKMGVTSPFNSNSADLTAFVTKDTNVTQYVNSTSA
jgi:serpin B